MQTRWIASDGGPLLFTRAWPGRRGAPHVFVGHSQPTHSGNVVDLANAFAEAGYGVFAGDLRGHGASVDARTPRGHLDLGTGWDDLIGDMARFLDSAFADVPWEDRVIVAANISALLVISLLPGRPDLARDIVLISPVPNQPALPILGGAFIRARLLFRGDREPDEQVLHHLYSFLGVHLKERNHLADVMSADRSIIEAILSDPLAWPTPTLGYWSAILEGLGRSWRDLSKAQVRRGTRVLVLYGGEDAMMRDGAFAPAIATKLRAAGIDDVSTARVEGGRSALFLDEKRLGIAARILSWRQNGCTPGTADVAARDLVAFSEDVLADMGRFSQSKAGTGGTLLPEELVELCYGAIDDEERWVEIMYRAVLSIERTEGRDTTEIETVFAQVMPHWDRSFQINRQVMINATLGVLLQHVIDRLEIGIALVDETGRVLHHNEVLVGTLSRALDPNGPRLRDADASALVARLVGSAAIASDTAETVILLEGQPIGFLCRPQSLRLTARQRGGPAALLVVRTSGQQLLREDQRIPLIELAYGLTRQEALVALKIVGGMSPDAVAEALDVSINTIRTHLRRCYEKIDVEGQTEMVARILSGPVGWLSPG